MGVAARRRIGWRRLMRGGKRTLVAFAATGMVLLGPWAPGGKEAAVVEAATIPKKALVTASALNVRMGPATTYAATGRLVEGAEVTILERKGDWFRIAGPGLTGWVHGDYLTARLDGVRIVVDPGHGGIDGGAMANGLVEREVNLAISLYLRDVLRARGAEVRMTRETWESRPPLCNRNNPYDPSTRTGIANAWPADMLLSIHNNWSSSASARGLLTIWGRAPQSQALARVIHDRTLYWTRTRQGFDHRSFGSGVYRDSAISGSTLAITNCSRVPATIVEVAFLTNKDDAALLKSEAFLQAVARGIADGAGAFVLERVPEGPLGGDDANPDPDPDPNPTPEPDPDPGPKPFSDVGGTLADEVYRAHELGLVDGYRDGRFRPQEPVTRAAMAKMVVLAVERATGKDLPTPSESPYRDVNSRQALYEYVLTATAAKYLHGYGDGTFRPDLAMPREQVAAVLQRAAGLEGSRPSFDDVSSSSPFASAIGAVAKAGLMHGEGHGRFGYGKPITRAQAAAVAVRLHDLLKEAN